MDDKEKKRLQQVVGVFLYYARAVDPTMLHALNVLATQQAKGTENTIKAMNHFLNYCATHPDATIRYHASDMILHVHTDASYLSEPEAKSRYGGFHFLGDKDNYTKLNGPILSLAKMIKNVVSSAAEAELAGIFNNAKEAAATRVTLEEMRHLQGETNIICDNETAVGITNKTVKHKMTKAMNMRYYWIRDREAQGQFKILWEPGETVRAADFHSKHHPAGHHRTMRPVIFNMH